MHSCTADESDKKQTKTNDKINITKSTTAEDYVTDGNRDKRQTREVQRHGDNGRARGAACPRDDLGVTPLRQVSDSLRVWPNGQGNHILWLRCTNADS